MGPTRRRLAGPPEPRVESHEIISGTEILLRTTTECNQRCHFCFLPPVRRSFAWEDILGALREVARRPQPPKILTLSGGEPTADSRLPRILTAARRLGIRRFVLQTNAVRLSDASLLGRLNRLGVEGYVVSFHSHKPARYDEITRSRGQYSRAVAGIRRLIRGRCRLTINVVVNARNYEDLPELVAFLARQGAGKNRAKELDVYFSMINEAGHQLAPDWAVGLERVSAPLRRALEVCDQAGIRVAKFVGGSCFPVCLTAHPERYACERALSQERVRYAVAFSGASGAIGRAKHPDCRDCAYDSRCLGVPASYATHYGVAALRVVKMSPLCATT